jgi:hypothetical protein
LACRAFRRLWLSRNTRAEMRDPKIAAVGFLEGQFTIVRAVQSVKASKSPIGGCPSGSPAALRGPLWVLVVQKRPSGSIDASWLRLGGRGSSFSSGLSVFWSGSASDEDFGQQRTADRAREAQLGPVTIMSKRIRLPNGLFLRYDDPDKDLWGGKLLENLCQALARVVIMQAALRLGKRGYRFVIQAHHELAFCISDDQLEEAKTIIMQEMTRPPAWMPELPLQAEIGVGNNYGEVR